MNRDSTSLRSMLVISTFFEGLFTDLKGFWNDFAITIDARYVRRRLHAEGFGFVMELTKLGKLFDISLVSGVPFVAPNTFCRINNGVLPKFLSSLTRRIFRDDGHLLTCLDPNYIPYEAASAVAFVRQVCSCFAKYRDLVCVNSDAKLKDEFLTRVVGKPTVTTSSVILNIARSLLKSLLCSDDGEELCAELAQWDDNPVGWHGNGAVFDRSRGWQKWIFNRIDGYDPLLFKWSNHSYTVEKQGIQDSRLCLVPKDFRGKRVICIESKESQFAQQGLRRVLYDIVDNHPLTRHSIRFVDQRPNRRLCRDYRYATIDLKDASDLVSLDLCRLLFPSNVFRVLTRYRARHVVVDQKAYSYSAFATMGSALCFPVETLVFWSLCVATLKSHNISGRVRVFGDDIIVPCKAYNAVIETLCQSGFRINLEKSCTTGSPIRESCGAWYYLGFDVSNIKLKTLDPSSVEAWTNLRDLAILLIENCLINSARVLLDLMSHTFGVPNSFRYLNGNWKYLEKRWNTDLQRYEEKVPSPFAGRGSDHLNDDLKLYAWITGQDTRPSTNGTVKVEMVWTELFV